MLEATTCDRLVSTRRAVAAPGPASCASVRSSGTHITPYHQNGGNRGGPEPISYNRPEGADRPVTDPGRIGATACARLAIPHTAVPHPIACCLSQAANVNCIAETLET